MTNTILDELTEQDIFGLIYLATEGEMCSNKQTNVLIRGEIYSINSTPKNAIDRVTSSNKTLTIEFTDNEVKYYNGKLKSPALNSSYKKVVREIGSQLVQ